MPKVSGPKIAARQGAPSGHNRGTQGYPVPPEQLAQVEPNPDLTDVVEDVVINQIVVPTDVVKRGDPTDVMDAGNPLDIVQKAIVNDLMASEARVVEDTDGSDDTMNQDKRSQIIMAVHGFKDKLAKRGCGPGTEIAHGSRGIAYNCDGGKVLKITTDPDEASASMKIKGVGMKHVAKIFDVFKFPENPRKKYKLFGVVLEKLHKMDNQETVDFQQMGKYLQKVEHFWELLPKDEFQQKLQEKIQEDPSLEKGLRWAAGMAEKFQAFEIAQELKKHGIRWVDMHSGNIMKRGNDYVAVDLGASDVDAPPEVPVLEKTVTEATLRLLREAQTDQVGVTIGRFQPFHRGHADLIRELARKFNKVIVIVGGLKKDEKNPFSFKLRQQMMEGSMPDIFSKLEIHEAKYGGKNSGFVPGILSEIIDQNESTLNKDTAVHVLVGQDRVQDMKGQMARALAMKQAGDEMSFDPSMAEVTAIPNASEDGNGRVSGTKMRQALEQGDERAVAKMVDPHLLSDPTKFHEIYSELRKELGVRDVNESINNAGGLRAIEETLDQNQDKLRARKPYPIGWPDIKELGHGEDGYAYDMGGNKVFKVTTDPGEAIASHQLEGENTQAIVRIFDVFKFPPTQGTQGSRTPLFGIVTEKLTKLSSQEQDELNGALGWIMDPDFKSTTRQKFMRGDWNGTIHDIELAMTRLFQAGEIAEAVGDATANVRVGGRQATNTQPSVVPGGSSGPGRKMSSQEARNAAKQKVQTVKATLEKFNLPAMAKELASKGIKFGDYHSGNLMKRGSTYVINDLGHSGVRGGQEPPILESIAETVLAEFGAFSGPGNTGVGPKAGRSAWSASINRPDPDVEDLWQTNLKNLDVKIGDGGDITDSSPEINKEE